MPDHLRGYHFRFVFYMFLHVDILPLWFRWANRPDYNHLTHFKNTPVVHFSAFVNLATETLASLPVWRLKFFVYIHLGEYNWKDFSSPAFTK